MPTIRELPWEHIQDCEQEQVQHAATQLSLQDDRTQCSRLNATTTRYYNLLQAQSRAFFSPTTVPSVMAPASSMASNSTQSLITLVFGITATTISIITIWQGYKFWKTWSECRSGQDIEAGYPSRVYKFLAISQCSSSSYHAEHSFT